MTEDFPRRLAIKVDQLLDAVSAGQIAPDPLELLGVAMVLEQHGELVRAARCIAIARRMLPGLHSNPVIQS